MWQVLEEGDPWEVAMVIPFICIEARLLIACFAAIWHLPFNCIMLINKSQFSFGTVRKEFGPCERSHTLSYHQFQIGYRDLTRGHLLFSFLKMI